MGVSQHQVQNMSEAVDAVEQMADAAFNIAEQSQALATIARETYHAIQTRREVARVSKSLNSIFNMLERQIQAIEGINTNIK